MCPAYPALPYPTAGMHSRAGDPDMSELAPIVAAPASLRREPDRRRRGRRIFLPPRGRTLAAGAWNRPLRIPATGGEESERRVPHAIALPAEEESEGRAP